MAHFVTGNNNSIVPSPVAEGGTAQQWNSYCPTPLLTLQVKKRQVQMYRHLIKRCAAFVNQPDARYINVYMLVPSNNRNSNLLLCV